MLTLQEVVNLPIDQLEPYISIKITKNVELTTFINWLEKNKLDVECNLDLEIGGNWPTEQELSILSKNSSVISFNINQPISLSQENPIATLEFIRFLRDSISLGLKVLWRCSSTSTIDFAYLTHLPPPLVETSDDHQFATWKEEYKFGKLFWRNGPGFIIIKDTRSKLNTARYILDDSAILETFHKLQLPIQINEFEGNVLQNQALQSLTVEKIVIGIDDWYLSLPFRIRNWPIPYMSI